ncbi:MAG TPA: PKD domain-containing protein [Candidatus Thermoplasmatota archaeon]|nr:PKD domain-containing protein [Candidatus Thermoplasmatota archaeon]
MRRPLVPIGIAIMIAASGCFGQNEAAPASDASDAATGTSSPAGTNDTVPPAPNAPPVASINASVLVGKAPLNVTFNLTGSDADGDVLNWTLDVDGDNATDASGAELPGNASFIYELPGLYNVTLKVSDGEAEAVANLTVEVVGGAPGPTSRADPTGDADADLMDVKLVELSFQDDKMVAVLSIVRVWPSTQAVSPVSYSLSINGRQLDSFVRYPTDANPMTWDTVAGGYMPAGTSTWDTTANKVTFRIPVTWLEETAKFTAPYKVHAAGNIGGVGATEENDRAPDAGEIDWG